MVWRHTWAKKGGCVAGVKFELGELNGIRSEVIAELGGGEAVKAVVWKNCRGRKCGKEESQEEDETEVGFHGALGLWF